MEQSVAVFAMSRIVSLSVLIVFVTTTYCVAQTVVINEFMASNSHVLYDEDGDAPDWIELFNPSDCKVNVSRYSLSDDVGNVNKWVFPDTILDAGAYMLVFASGKNRRKPGRTLHTNFKINTDGEDLLLAYNGVVQQHIEPVRLKTNESYGAVPDGSGNFFVFTNPTPGHSNSGYYHRDKVAFSHPGGIYQSAFELTLECLDPDHSIYYTLDGSTPSSESQLYSGPMQLCSSYHSRANIAYIPVSPPHVFREPIAPVRKCILIRAAVFDGNNKRISDVETHTYLIRDEGIDHADLPIISISAEHKYLFDHRTGIMVPGMYWKSETPDWTGNYFQRGSDWERSVFIEFFEPENTLGFRQQVGLRIHGGSSRGHMQKGFRIYARSDYGRRTMDHKLFETRETDSFKRLVLRPFMTSGSQAGSEDYIACVIASRLDIDWLATRPVVLYINGEYWGTYFLQERFDEHHLATYYGVPENEVDIIQSWRGQIAHGEDVNFHQLYSFIEEHDLSIDANYNTVSDWMDIDNFIDYQLFEIVIANIDWPANNMKLWRHRKDGAKWRWVFHDGDAAFLQLDHASFDSALTTSHTSWPSNARSTLFLRKLLMNAEFSDKFFDRLEFLLNNELSFVNTSAIWLEIMTRIRDDIVKQYDRFGRPTRSQWLDATYNIHHFLRYRPCVIQEQARDLFDRNIKVPPCKALSVQESDAQSELDVVVYPNPSRGRFSIQIHTKSNDVSSIYLYNIFGRRIALRSDFMHEGVSTFVVDRRDLPSGVYLLVVQGRSVFTSRLLIEQ